MPFTVLKLGLAALATGTAALSLVYLRRKSNSLEAEVERAFRDHLLHSVADWSATQIGRSLADLRAELDTAFASDWKVRHTVPGLARLDLRLQKDSATKVTRTVGIRLADQDHRIGALSREYAWDELPAHFRSAFIRQGESTLCWTLYDAGKLSEQKGSAHAANPSL